ncbi:hypothetical protein E2C01_062766 [Portunus trituberculatus]|uniref:Uncharacterized protein n=1 Tax=Portunus trituberculatus TaxID=210409 RepID=A0A5B7HIZ3_PORTR|nr:hypothetical protein [Portunus trituberculatus]
MYLALARGLERRPPGSSSSSSEECLDLPSAAGRSWGPGDPRRDKDRCAASRSSPVVSREREGSDPRRARPGGPDPGARRAPSPPARLWERRPSRLEERRPSGAEVVAARRGAAASCAAPSSIRALLRELAGCARRVDRRPAELDQSSGLPAPPPSSSWRVGRLDRCVSRLEERLASASSRLLVSSCIGVLIRRRGTAGAPAGTAAP